MAETTEEFLNHTWKGVITIGSLLFNAGIIVFCLLKGDAANSLHTSALAWSFMMGSGILIGLGIATLAPDIMTIFMVKK